MLRFDSIRWHSSESADPVGSDEAVRSHNLHARLFNRAFARTNLEISAHAQCNIQGGPQPHLSPGNGILPAPHIQFSSIAIPSTRVFMCLESNSTMSALLPISLLMCLYEDLRPVQGQAENATVLCDECSPPANHAGASMHSTKRSTDGANHPQRKMLVKSSGQKCKQKLSSIDDEKSTNMKVNRESTQTRVERRLIMRGTSPWRLKRDDRLREHKPSPVHASIFDTNDTSLSAHAKCAVAVATIHILSWCKDHVHRFKLSSFVQD